MSQYKTGKVSIEHGSAAVVGYNTTWDDDGITSGWIFMIKGEANIYWIDSVTDNTNIVLSQNYYNPRGVNLTSVAYAIVQDYTTNYSWPKIANSDYNWVNILRNDLLSIETDMAAGSRSTVTFDSPSQGTSGAYYVSGAPTTYYLPDTSIPAEEGVLYYDTYKKAFIYLTEGMTSGGNVSGADYLPIWVPNWREITTV